MHRSFHFELSSGYISIPNNFFGRFPEWEFGLPFAPREGAEDAEAPAGDYEKFSPDTHVGNWVTPTLVIHGGKDYR